jgi:conjugative transfer region lipoprotein (TIGR03751 family)
MLLIALINLSACSSVSGNVIPEKGPAMEQVYDSMDTSIQKPKLLSQQGSGVSLPQIASNSDFHKLANPELKMYVYPHLAGKDEVPVPGYYTAFNAYTQDHYALLNEI